MITKKLIAVAAEAEIFIDKAAALAQKLQLPIVDLTSTSHHFLLIYGIKRLELKQVVSASSPLPGPVFAEFLDGRLGFRRKHGGGKKQNIARAVGIKGGFRPTVIDATAGLGRDGFVLACLGCKVHMIERSPIIASLLQDGLQRASTDPETDAHILPNIQMTVADSLQAIDAIQAESKADTIYLDPMYPHRSKSSLVKKEMRYLRAIVGADHDGKELLAAALRCPVNRIVVKRPRLAESISGPQPSTVIVGKSSRYDIYFPVSVK